LNLINDTGTALVSPANVLPGAFSVLSNSRCAINTAATTISKAGNAVGVSLPISFNSVFTGLKNAYVVVFDNAGLVTHWVQGGSFYVQ
jgi:hypothetical protein